MVVDVVAHERDGELYLPQSRAEDRHHPRRGYSFA